MGSTATLCWAVFLLNWELPVKRVYLLKQSLTALVIRLNIQFLNAGGAAFNPALATGYSVWQSSLKSGKYTLPTLQTLLLYWAASLAGGAGAAASYRVAKRSKLLGAP